MILGCSEIPRTLTMIGIGIGIMTQKTVGIASMTAIKIHSQTDQHGFWAKSVIVSN